MTREPRIDTGLAVAARDRFRELPELPPWLLWLAREGPGGPAP